MISSVRGRDQRPYLYTSWAYGSDPSSPASRRDFKPIDSDFPHGPTVRWERRTGCGSMLVASIFITVPASLLRFHNPLSRDIHGDSVWQPKASVFWHRLPLWEKSAHILNGSPRLNGAWLQEPNRPAHVVCSGCDY